MRQKIIDFKKVLKAFSNVLFWILTILNITLYCGTIIYIWLKHSSIVPLNLTSDGIKELFSSLIFFNITTYTITFLANMYHFNNEIKKVISKDNLTITTTIKSLFLLIGIIFLLLSGVFYKISNITLSDFFAKTTYISIHLTLFISAFFLFYLFSFINVISQDETTNHALCYTYLLKIRNAADIKRSIIKRLSNQKIENGQYYNQKIDISYYISHEEAEYVYAFLDINQITYEFVETYAKDRITSFVEYLYTKILDKSKNVFISYFIFVNNTNENIKYLREISSYHDQHFTIMHNIIDLSKEELHISGVREDEKQNDINYETLKKKIENSVVDIIKISDNSIKKKYQI